MIHVLKHQVWSGALLVVAALLQVEAAAGAPTLTLQQDTLSERRISVAFVDTPLEDVLLAFADFSGRSIVFGPDVFGLVNAEVRDQPWDVALRAILESHGFTWEERVPGLLRVDALRNLLEARTWAATEIRAFPIRIGAASMYEQVIQEQLSSQGTVSVVAQSNVLLVRDTPNVLATVDSLLQEIQVPSAEITISATLLFVNRSRLAELGVAYAWNESSGGTDFDESAQVALRGPAIAAIGNASQRVSMPTLRLVMDLFTGRHRLVSFAEALESAYLSEVEASPQLRVQENHTARILVGERVPVPVFQPPTSEDEEWEAQLRLRPVGVQFQDVGIRLEVTPQITGCDEVLMDVHAERSGVERAESALGFVFHTQEASTRMRVRRGETAVLGGLVLREESELRTGIPLLMQLPWLGRFFRLTRRESVERDLVILITPSVHSLGRAPSAACGWAGHPSTGSPP